MIKRYAITITLAAVALLALFLILAAVTAVPQPSQAARAAALPLAAIEGCELIDPVVEEGYLRFKCVTAVPEPTATAVPTSTIEATPTLAATVTIEPTAVITPTGTPVGNVAPYPTAPLCAEHDDRAWHGLWNPVLGCHYDHHHGNDPHGLDEELGTAVYDLMGGEISYPWQTFSTAGTENDMKHEGYVWIVREGLDYPPRNNDGVVVDFRAVVHQLADGHDAPVRYHSFAIEANVCPQPDDPVQNGCGYAFVGGWQDTGDLQVDLVTVIDEPGSGNRIKQHSSHGPVAVWYPASTQGVQGQQGFARVSVTTHDQWDFTTADAPGEYTDFICFPAAACRANGTLFRPHLIMIDVPAAYEGIVDQDGDGIANWSGYLNRYGAIVDGCTAVGLDCVPIILENIRTDIAYNYADLDAGQDYDQYFCNGTPCLVGTPGARPAGWMQPVP